MSYSKIEDRGSKIQELKVKEGERAEKWVVGRVENGVENTLYNSRKEISGSERRDERKKMRE